MSFMIIVENLVKKFKDVIAVNDISFKIMKREIYALLGPNGAGKTTTIHVITTLLRPTSGRAYVAGYDVVRDASEVRKHIGVLFQDTSLDFDLSAYDNMYIHGKLYGLKGKELEKKIMELLEFVELKEFAHKSVKYFSGGMKRRLEIARSFLHEPEILILDEPTIGLDPQSRARIWDYIRYLRKEKDVTILITTHYMDEAEELADRIAIMDRGKIIAEGTSEELKSIIGSDVVYMKVENKSNKDLCSNLQYVRYCKEISFEMIEIGVGNASKAIPEIFTAIENAGIRVLEISYRRPSLNEVFLHLTGRELRDSETQPIFIPFRFRGR